MKLFDATLPIQEGMVTFPGDPPFKTTPFFQRQKGDPFDLALLSMGTHLGTHLDPPAHYLDRGAAVDELPLDALVGSGVVLDMTGRPSVDRQALEESEMGDHVRVLLKTDNSPQLLESSFHEDYVHLTEDGARYLVRRGASLLELIIFPSNAIRIPAPLCTMCFWKLVSWWWKAFTFWILRQGLMRFSAYPSGSRGQMGHRLGSSCGSDPFS